MRGLYWGLVLFISPLFVRIVGGGDLRFAKDTFFLWAGLFGAGIFGLKGLRSTSFYVFLVIASLTFWNQYQPYSVAVYHQMLMVMTGWLILAQALSFEEGDWRKMVPFIVASLVIQAVWPISNRLGSDPWVWIGLQRQWAGGGKVELTHTIIGALHNPSISAALLAACVPFVFVYKWVKYPLLALALAGLYYFNSSMAWLGIIAACWWWIATRSRIAGMGLILLAGIPAWILKGSLFFSSSGRMPAWETYYAFSKLQTPPRNLLGFGVGFIHDQFPLIYRAEVAFRQLHCEFMEIHAAWGGVGIICLLLMAAQIRDFKSPWFYSFLILWVNAAGNLTFHLAAMSLLMILSYARIVTAPGASIWERSLHAVSSRLPGHLPKA